MYDGTATDGYSTKLQNIKQVCYTSGEDKLFPVQEETFYFTY